MRNLLLALSVFFIACGSDSFEHDGVLDNGFKYKTIESKGGTPLQEHQVATIELKVVDDQNKVLSNTKNQRIKPSIYYPKTVKESLTKNPVFAAAKVMGIGDKAIIRVPVKKLEKAPGFYKHSKYVDYHLDIVNIQSFDDHAESQRATVKHLDGPEITEAKEVFDNFRNGMLRGQKRFLDSGVMIQLYNNANGTKYAESGDRVVVNYVGFLSNRAIFDDSYKRGKPYRFILDQDPMIAGWLEALKNIPEGASALVEVPPEQAYGEFGTPGIPPNTTLVFVLTLERVEHL